VNGFPQLPESIRSLAICANRARTPRTLIPVVRKARLLLDNRAYVHWYTRYGMELSEMADAIDAMENIIVDYNKLEEQ
jgi:hypothetical protein